MLHFSQSQFQLLEAAQRRRFIDECVRDLQAEHAQASATGPELQEQVRLMVEQLMALGFRNAGDCKHALGMLFRLQRESWRGPMPQAILARLESAGTTVERKIEALEQLFIFGGGPDGSPRSGD